MRVFVSMAHVAHAPTINATIAWWEGEKLNLYDATQYISGVKQSIARGAEFMLA
jgi:hypothetical protein